jgi:hypothetical protein
MTDVTRRDLVKAGGATAAALAVSSIVTFASRPAVGATGLTADDVTVSANDGELDSLTLAPEITVSWDGWAEPVTTVEATWYVKTSSTSETTVGSTPFTFDVSSPGKSGSISRSMSSINLLSNNGGALSGSNFDETTDGASKTTDVTLSMDGKLKDSEGTVLADRTDLLGPKTFSVTVENTASTVSSSGSANTDGT